MLSRNHWHLPSKAVTTAMDDPKVLRILLGSALFEFLKSKQSNKTIEHNLTWFGRANLRHHLKKICLN